MTERQRERWRDTQIQSRRTLSGRVGGAGQVTSLKPARSHVTEAEQIRPDSEGSVSIPPLPCDISRVQLSEHHSGNERATHRPTR